MKIKLNGREVIVEERVTKTYHFKPLVMKGTRTSIYENGEKVLEATLMEKELPSVATLIESITEHKEKE